LRTVIGQQVSFISCHSMSINKTCFFRATVCIRSLWSNFFSNKSKSSMFDNSQVIVRPFYRYVIAKRAKRSYGFCSYKTVKETLWRRCAHHRKLQSQSSTPCTESSSCIILLRVWWRLSTIVVTSAHETRERIAANIFVYIIRDLKFNVSLCKGKDFERNYVYRTYGIIFSEILCSKMSVRRLPIETIGTHLKYSISFNVSLPSSSQIFLFFSPFRIFVIYFNLDKSIFFSKPFFNLRFIVDTRWWPFSF
jgi:hypothetical protein